MISRADITPSTARPYFGALDGFRGLLALFVAMYHTIWLSHPNTHDFFNNGPVIIDLFFAFSGFLMFVLYDGRLQGRADLRDFMAKRFARLMPLHVFMLLIFVAFAGFRLWAHDVGLAAVEPGEVLPFEDGAPESWRNLLAHLTLTHAMGGADALTYNPPSWTVGAEFWAYGVFALGAIGLGLRKIGWGLGLLLAAAIAGIYIFLSTQGPNMDMTYGWGFVRCLGGFFTGVLAARVFQVLRLDSRYATLVECFTLIGAVAFVVYCGGRAQFWVAPVLFIFVFVFAHDGGAISRLMKAKPFAYLAKISYSVYLTHVIISIVFAVFAERFIAGNWPNWNETGLGGDLLMVPYLLTVIAVSHVTYHWIEVPGGKWLRRVLTRRRLALAPAKV